jgi:hypothetical protein
MECGGPPKCVQTNKPLAFAFEALLHRYAYLVGPTNNQITGGSESETAGGVEGRNGEIGNHSGRHGRTRLKAFELTLGSALRCRVLLGVRAEGRRGLDGSNPSRKVRKVYGSSAFALRPSLSRFTCAA